MKTLLLFLFFTSIVHATYQNWELIWSDEFEQSGLPDNSKWEFDTEGNSWDWGNNEEQNYTPSDYNNAWVDNGVLTIEARQEEYTAPQDSETKQYTSARLRTKNLGDWTEGRFEIRAKIPAGVGTWPAIWMLPTDDIYGGWPNSGEIDIMEAIGSEPTTHYSTVWCTNSENSDGDGSTIKLSDQGDSFHTYVMEWYSDSLLFFVDSQKVHTYYNEHTDAKQWPFDRRFHLLLNVAVGGDWEKIVDPESFPARMEVDFVRVYQQIHEAGISSGSIAVHGSLWMKQVEEGVLLQQNEGSFASIELYQLNGKQIYKKDLGFLGEGKQVVSLPTNLSKGLYITKLITSDGVGEMKIKIQ